MAWAAAAVVWCWGRGGGVYKGVGAATWRRGQGAAEAESNSDSGPSGGGGGLAQLGLRPSRRGNPFF